MGYLIYLRFYCILIIGFIGRVCTHMTVINDNDKWQDFNVEQYTTNVYDSSLKTTLMPAKTLSVYSEQNGINGPISVYNDYIGGDDMHIKHDDEQKHGIHESADIDRHSTQGHNDNYTPSAESNAFSEEYEESSSKAVFNNCETEKNNGKMHSNEFKPENSQQYQSKGNKHTHCFDEDLHNRRPRRDQPEQKSFEKGLEIDFIQKELGEEYIVPPKRPKQIPGYVAMLYDILTEQDERTLIPASSEKIKSRPKIRFYRGLFHGIGKNKWISYDMKDIDLEQVTRLEFVVKMPKMKERNTSISLRYRQS
ncbi:uncharacterized protein LOC127862558 isoform X2 [Dreissena polymorpha]|uniref:uncharacterized protein LOC127862558 isoform X2 n=1 Tax=Dreissena polymorpha TaxID=45954 RepID=UPI0022656656|nr:uncharacterized protein LOC127862558 isoform X2 [Dreissena polymorpha]